MSTYKSIKHFQLFTDFSVIAYPDNFNSNSCKVISRFHKIIWCHFVFCKNCVMCPIFFFGHFKQTSNIWIC